MKKMFAGLAVAAVVVRGDRAGGGPSLVHRGVRRRASRSSSPGTVTKIEWTNPHAYFFIDVRDESGKVTNWGLEMGSPNGLMRQGWTRTSLKVGDVVTVDGSRAKDGSNVANAKNVTLANGQRLFAASSQGNGS